MEVSPFICNIPTPENPNNPSTILGRATTPDFSLTGGFYTGNQLLQITSNIPGAIIRYTIDSSDPTEESAIYSGEIVLEKLTKETHKLKVQKYSWPDDLEHDDVYTGTREFAMVVKARVFANNYLPGKTIGATYFIDMRQPTLPVVSLSTDYKHLFSDETGIYVEGFNTIDGSVEDANWNHGLETTCLF